MAGRYSIWIVSPPGLIWSHVFDEVALALQSGFKTLGHDVPIVTDPRQASGTVLALGANLIPYLRGALPLPKDMIIFNMEQIHGDSRWFRPNSPYIDLLKRYPVWDYSRKNFAALAELGVKDVVYCGVGYAPELTRNLKARQDIDALLIGGGHPRRDKLLDELRDAGRRVHHVFEVFGKERDRWMARGKLHLNIHKESAHLFEVVRVSYLLANRCFVVSETGTDDSMEAPFKDALIFCDYDKIVERCQYYLDRPKERKAVAEGGFEISRTLPQSAYLEAALADHRRVFGERPKKGKAAAPLPRIFVNIASYRDLECQHTVRDLFGRAAHPERVNVGVCWQYDPEEDAECFAVKPPRPQQVQFIHYHYKDGKGANWARRQAMSLWKDEDYILQIDSHMRFEPDWDRTLIDLIGQCPSDKPMLTAWVPGYLPPNLIEKNDGTLQRMCVHRMGKIDEAQLINIGRINRPAESVKGRMEPTPFCIANCLFGPARAFSEVPFDPYIEFWGDEINQSARLWTHGWDLYQLDRRVLYHFWGPQQIKDRDTYRDRDDPRHQRANRRNLHLFGIRACDDPQVVQELDFYGLGRERSLDDYWKFAGVNLSDMTATPEAHEGRWSAPAISQPRIFVAIASYRDAECQPTLDDLFARAAHSARIHAGVCLQVDPKEDGACMLTPRPGQLVRVRQAHWRDSRGANWARDQALQLWDGEEYVLMIDSHMRFEPGWDELLIDMLARCPSKKPVISGYAANYDPPDRKAHHPDQLLRIRIRELGRENQTQPVHITGKFIDKGDPRAGLCPSPLVIANFVFMPAETLRDVPIDPHIHFWGDEINYAARLWTHGYDIFQPDRQVLYHYWVRKSTFRLQHYRNMMTEDNKRSRLRLRHLLGFERTQDTKTLADIERYGLGRERKLEDLWEFIGIDWKLHTVTNNALEGIWNMTAREKGLNPAQPLRGSQDKRIFVQIASYRDTDCQWTVKDMFDKAAHPERIFAGICWQFVKEEDAVCFEQPYPYPDQVRVHEVDARQGRGACWARSLVQQLWQGEEFTLQIDSHMRFEPGWDELLLSMWKECADEKAILTAYPPGFTPPDDLQRKWIYGMAANQFDKHNILLLHGVPGFEVAKNPPKQPIPGAFVSGCMLFGPGSLIKDVPYDPHLYFFGEEISLAARLWTSGYNFYHPHKLCIYHDWDRGKRKTHFADHRDWGKLNDLSQARVRHLLGTEKSGDPQVLQELDKYGFGRERTLAQYQAFSGVDFAAKTIAFHAKKGLFGPDRPAEPAPAIIHTVNGKQPRIFVNIASYRDPECQWTVKDLFEKAAHPDRIHVGICWQFDPQEDKHCFEVSTRPEQVRMLPVDWREAEGVCWARHQTQQLWDGEEYTLMIDSHMRFVPGWDELMIRELADCESDKPLLSCSPPPYLPPNRLGSNMNPTVRRVRPFTPDGNIRCQAEMLDRPPPKPLKGAFLVANFVFSDSSILKEVPYDPYLYFDQEEITYAARLYTHGWDMFSSRRQFLYHYYNDLKAPGGTVRPLHWHDLRKKDEQRISYLKNRALKRFNHMTGFKASQEPDVVRELDKYGFGRARTLKQFEEFSGVDFKNKIAGERALRCQFIEDLAKYRDRPIRVPEIDDAPKANGAGVQAPAKPPEAARSPQLPAKPLEPGDYMPMFEVMDTTGKKRALEVHAGRHSLFFYIPARPDYADRFFRELQDLLKEANLPNIWQIYLLDDTVEGLNKLKQALRLPHMLWTDHDRAIARALGLVKPGESAVVPAGFVLDNNLKIISRHLALDAKQLAAAVVGDAKAALEESGRRNASPPLVKGQVPALIVPNVLTPELRARCLQAFRTGHTFEGTVGANESRAYRPDTKVRTDYIVGGSLLAELDEKFSRSFFPEIRKVFGVEVKYREIYKIGMYAGERGGFFKAHRDNFDNPLGYRRIASTIHLNDDYEGGGLRFPEYDSPVYRPDAGAAIAFSCSTLHEALPVTKGERFVIVAFFHGEEDEAYRRHYQMSQGQPIKIKDYLPALRDYSDLRMSRDFFKDWQAEHVAYERSSAAVSAPPNIMINTLGGHRARKVHESKAAIILDDFLPEDEYKKIYDYALTADYEYINTKGKVSRAWHVHDGFPLRSALNLFYYADDADKPKNVDYIYPTKKPWDTFVEQLLAVQPQVRHLTGTEKTGWGHFSVTGWIYPHGTGLSMHDDGSGIYTGAYVYFLNPVWRPHWGGLLLLMDDEANRKIHDHRATVDQIDFYKRKWLHASRADELVMEHGFARCVLPKKNRIVFIANDAYHMVTRVNEQAGDNLRMSLAGFFNRKK